MAKTVAIRLPAFCGNALQGFTHTGAVCARALAQMVDAHRSKGGHMVATMDVPREDVSSYGVLDVSQQKGRIAQARGLVEKPRPEMAPSTQAIVGRYILEPSIFDRLDALGPSAGGELQLTDAINADVQTAGVTGYQFDGERFDCGSVQGFVQATAAFAMARGDLSADFAAFMEARKIGRASCRERV